MSITHASFWDVVDGYERKEDQDKKHLAALEGLLRTVCNGVPPVEAARKWRQMGEELQLPNPLLFFCQISNAIEYIEHEAPGILSFPVSDTAPDCEESP